MLCKMIQDLTCKSVVLTFCERFRCQIDKTPTGRLYYSELLSRYLQHLQQKVPIFDII